MTNVWTAIAHPNQSFSIGFGKGTVGAALGLVGSTTYPETFNGTAWTTQPGNNGSVTSWDAVSGSTSSILGFNPATCELWDGTTWITGSPIGVSWADTSAGCGSSTSAAVCAYVWFGSFYATYTYDGVSWTNKSASHGFYPENMVGTESAGLLIQWGTATALWNGTAWSAGGTRITGTGYGLTGTSSAGLCAGVQAAQSYSGTTWTGESSIPSGMSGEPGMAGDASEAIAFSTTKAYHFDTQVLSAPVADFSGTPTSGLIPLTVDFTDLSTNQPTTWDWDWGDGATHGNTQNPTHIFTLAGTWTVTLTASNAYGEDDEEKIGYVVTSGGGGGGELEVGDKVVVKRTVGKTIVVRV